MLAAEARLATSQNYLQTQFCKLADCSGGDAETRRRIVAQQAFNDVRLAALERPYALVTELKQHARGTLGWKADIPVIRLSMTLEPDSDDPQEVKGTLRFKVRGQSIQDYFRALCIVLQSSNICSAGFYIIKTVDLNASLIHLFKLSKSSRMHYLH